MIKILKGSVINVKKTIVAVALVLIFVLALAAPAFAMVHVGVAKVNGNVFLNKQVGHKCNTGMEQTQTIRGNGELTKDWSITMVKAKATVVDKNDFVSAAGTAAPLVITSEIRLCTPPKYTYKDTVDGVTTTAPVGITAIYNPAGESMPASWGVTGGVWGFSGTTVGAEAAAVASGKWKALTTQTWAAQVKADPGFSGKLYQDFEAAYGAFKAGAPRATDAAALTGNDVGKWAWGTSATGALRTDVGASFVGDYFKMNQTARTSMGEVSRYIDMSSPWTGSYLYEDTVFKGFAEVVENFNMTNITAGADVPGKWWKGLFTPR